MKIKIYWHVIFENREKNFSFRLGIFGFEDLNYLSSVFLWTY